MGIPVNALSIRAVYWRKMYQNISNIHILWAVIWLNELRLKAHGCIICSTIYFPAEIDMHRTVAYFSCFDRKIKSWAVRFYRGCPYSYMYNVSYFSTNFPVGFILNHEHSPVSAIWTATSLFRVTQHKIQHTTKNKSTCLDCQYNKALSCNVI